MPTGMIVLSIAVAIGVAVIIYALVRRRKSALRSGGGSKDTTASEFAALPEPARCDIVFAMAALEDDGSSQLLQLALDDPSETVTLAAARALAGRGLTSVVDTYFARHPGERTDRISRALAVLAPDP
jgi:hypothetical protein